MKYLEKKVVVIIGASEGIGKATAKKLAEAGAHVVLAARNEEKLKKVVNEIHSSGGSGFYKVTDVTDKTQVEELIDYAIEKFGKVDTLINGAGLMLFSMWKNAKIEEWEKMIDLNIKGVLNGIYSVLPHLMSQRNGQIINIGSIAGHSVGQGHGVYSSTKYAIKAITESLRLELSKEYGIQISMISPGVIKTKWQDQVTDPDVKSILEELNEVAIDVEHVAEAIMYMVNQPSDVTINDLIVTPTVQEW